MIPIIICEDQLDQRNYLEDVVQNHILFKEYPMCLALSTDAPSAVLEHLESHQNQKALYFLDVNLNDEINGIELATRIREVNFQAMIVFITTHPELSFLTFKHKVEAMDYILKDSLQNIKHQVRECIDVAHQRYLDFDSVTNGSYIVKNGSVARVVPFNEIMFFASHEQAHKVVLHLTNGQITFYEAIKNLNNIGPSFFRCHKSFVVNLQNVKSVDFAKKTIEMTNGEIALCTTRKMSALMEALKKYHA